LEALLFIALAPLVALLIWLALIAFAGLGVPSLPEVDAEPTTDERAAAEALDRLLAADPADISDATRTRLLRPVDSARGTIVMWHGFTNCPAQFAEVAEELRSHGYFVLVARIPYHGKQDRLSRDLEQLAVEELAVFMNRCVDVAAGLPRPLTAVGFSAGGGLATWASATRDEIDRVVAISPLVAPKGFPVWVVRLLVRFRTLLPSAWVWWDPRQKAKFGGASHVYPGFPMAGLVPFLHVGLSLHDERILASHRLSSAALISNPNDLAVRTSVAEIMMARVFCGMSPAITEHVLKRSLGWPHDFIDQHTPASGDAADIAGLILHAMGEKATPRVRALIEETARLDTGEGA
jgi:carboxylesterase